MTNAIEFWTNVVARCDWVKWKGNVWVMTSLLIAFRHLNGESAGLLSINLAWSAHHKSFVDEVPLENGMSDAQHFWKAWRCACLGQAWKPWQHCPSIILCTHIIIHYFLAVFHSKILFFIFEIQLAATSALFFSLIHAMVILTLFGWLIWDGF